MPTATSAGCWRPPGTGAYSQDPARAGEDVAAYRAAVGDGCELRAVLRPGRPDTSSARHLAAKVRAAVAGGADAVDFYHYGLVPLPVLDRIPDALRPEPDHLSYVYSQQRR